MRMYDILLKKKRGLELSREELRFFVEGFTKGEIPDYQASALLMAVCLKGMTDKETAELTIAMAESGDMLELSSLEGITVDKHSTGGVGDKTSLIVKMCIRDRAKGFGQFLRCLSFPFTGFSIWFDCYESVYLSGLFY